ncbi:MAG: 6-carboxytetrahydropterin synthase QueD [Lentisphaeria bacterium]|nr:6-carboxytetrahydropterin synthase QueD [Lentisphaeria bacterium]MBQ7395861.1 6-carboxytetrahydropterin synthase QueD [Lentisphaeria bacterium]MBR7118762.1 6-carboxytetrahydropterin synthase QueD [Lentisphaeria bacterium]
MYEIEIRRTFSAAHQLKGYDGDCKNLHGHNYSVVVTVKSPELDSIGIAMDFKVLKSEVDNLLKGYDHKNLSELPDFADINPTSEVLARTVYRKLSERLNNGLLKVYKVRIGESENSAITYYED